MPSNKRHHYVPRFYLKNFSGDGRSINLFNLDQNRIVRNASFKTQCYKDYYYGRNQVLEKLLADIEGESAQILAYIIENRQLPSTNEQRKKLSIYLMAQHGRIPNTTAVVSEMRDGLASAVGDIAKERGEAEVQDFSNLDAVLTSVAISIRAYTCLADLEGRLLLSAPGQEFITSDTPVASCNSFFSYRPFGDAASFGWRGYQLVFPISPSLALFLFDSQIYSVKPLQGTPVFQIQNSRDMDQINGVQIAGAYENVFFQNPDTDITRLARIFMNKDRSLDRVKVNVMKTGLDKGLIAMQSRGNKSNLDLSFVSVKSKAKLWLAGFQQQKMQPAVVMRPSVHLGSGES